VFGAETPQERRRRRLSGAAYWAGAALAAALAVLQIGYAIANAGEEGISVRSRGGQVQEMPPIVFGGIGLVVLLVAWMLAMTAHVARLDARPDVLLTTDAVILTPTVVGARGRFVVPWRDIRRVRLAPAAEAPGAPGTPGAPKRSERVSPDARAMLLDLARPAGDYRVEGSRKRRAVEESPVLRVWIAPDEENLRVIGERLARPELRPGRA